MIQGLRIRRCLTVGAVAIALGATGTAHADDIPSDTTKPPSDTPQGDAENRELMASVTHSRIRVTQSGGGGGEKGNLAPADVNWEPPACWYEPVFTPEQLKRVVKEDKIDYVGIHESWSNGIFVDHYEKGVPNDNFDLDAPQDSVAEGYKNYNIGKDGYFWRSVAPDTSASDS